MLLLCGAPSFILQLLSVKQLYYYFPNISMIYSLHTALQILYTISYIIYSRNDIFLFYYLAISMQIDTNFNK